MTIRDIPDTQLLRFVVLSDLHLVPEGQTSWTLDTYDRLLRGVEAVNARHGQWDFVVLAGDLADRGEAEAYERLRTAVAGFDIPCHITLGNHDDRETFLQVFGEGYRAATGKVDKVIDIKGARVILLDSTTPGQHGGTLEQVQLDWLQDRLDEARDRPVIVILHHHAAPLGTRVDRIVLEQAEALVTVLATHPDVRQVIAGHVHYPSTSIWRGVPFTTMAGGHYSVTPRLWDVSDEVPPHRLTGPAQMALVLHHRDQTLVHFDDYISDADIIPETAQ